MSLFVQAIPEWLELLSLACCTGVFVSLLWVLPPGHRRAVVDPAGVIGALWRLAAIGAATLFASSILVLLARSAEMSGHPFAQVLPVLPIVVLRTHFGHVWIVRAAAIVALWITVLVARRRRLESVLLRCVMLGCALIVSALGSASGHAADTGDFSVAEIVDFLHLLPAMVWGGGLLVVSMVILPRIVKQGDAAESVASVAARLSRLAGIAVGLLVLTALYQEWAYRGEVQELVRSSYGRTIIAKVTLFTLLLFLGAFNRYVIVPRLRAWSGFAATTRSGPGRLVAPRLTSLARETRGPLVAAWFIRAMKLEAVLVVAALLCAALLRHQVPPRHAAHLEHEADATGALLFWNAHFTTATDTTGPCPR